MAGLEDSGETIEALKAKYFTTQNTMFLFKGKEFIAPIHFLKKLKSNKAMLLFLLGVVAFNIFWVLFLPAEYTYAWEETILPYLRALSIFHVSPRLLNDSPLGVFAEFMSEWLSVSWVFMSLCFGIYCILQYKELYTGYKIIVFYLKVADKSDTENYKNGKFKSLIGAILFFVAGYYLIGDAVYGDHGTSTPPLLERLAMSVDSRLALAISLQMYFFVVHVLLFTPVLYMYMFYLFYWIMKYLVRPFRPDLFADIDQNIRPEDREALRARMMAESAGAERGAPKPQEA